MRLANKSSARRGAALPFASLSMSATTQVSSEGSRRSKAGAEGVQLAVDSSSKASVSAMTKLQNPILLAHDSTIPKVSDHALPSMSRFSVQSCAVLQLDYGEIW